MTSRIDEIVDKMAQEDREVERKQNMLDMLSEPAETPASTHVEYDELDTSIIPARFVALKKEDVVVDAFSHVDTEETVVPNQRSVIRTTETGTESRHNSNHSNNHTSQTEASEENTKSSFWKKFVGNVKDFFAPTEENNSEVPTHLVKSRELKMERQREEYIMALCYETFAYIDDKRNGSITKDQAWIYICEMSKYARDVLGESFDIDEWLVIRDDFQDYLLQYKKYHITMEQFVHALVQINVDDQTLQRLMQAMLKQLIV